MTEKTLDTLRAELLSLQQHSFNALHKDITGMEMGFKTSITSETSMPSETMTPHPFLCLMPMRSEKNPFYIGRWGLE